MKETPPQSALPTAPLTKGSQIVERTCRLSRKVARQSKKLQVLQKHCSQTHRYRRKVCTKRTRSQSRIPALAHGSQRDPKSGLLVYPCSNVPFFCAAEKYHRFPASGSRDFPLWRWGNISLPHRLRRHRPSISLAKCPSGSRLSPGRPGRGKYVFLLFSHTKAGKYLRNNLLGNPSPIQKRQICQRLLRKGTHAVCRRSCIHGCRCFFQKRNRLL